MSHLWREWEPRAAGKGPGLWWPCRALPDPGSVHTITFTVPLQSPGTSALHYGPTWSTVSRKAGDGGPSQLRTEAGIVNLASPEG